MEADVDAELRFYEARAAALCASPERAAVGAQPPMDPPPPPPPEQLEIVGDTLKVHFFGVAENNWNLGVHGIGIKRGMTGKGEFSFFDIISLNIDSKFSFSTAGSFADFILETYLDPGVPTRGLGDGYDGDGQGSRFLGGAKVKPLLARRRRRKFWGQSAVLLNFEWFLSGRAMGHQVEYCGK